MRWSHPRKSVSDEDVDHNWVAILALLLGVTQHLDHLILILT